MNREAPSSRSHGIAWALAWCIGVVLVYLLSVPPVYQRVFVARGNLTLPGWLDAYCTPYFWLLNKTPLRTPLDAYNRWWMPLTGCDKLLEKIVRET